MLLCTVWGKLLWKLGMDLYLWAIFQLRCISLAGTLLQWAWVDFVSAWYLSRTFFLFMMLFFACADHIIYQWVYLLHIFMTVPLEFPYLSAVIILRITKRCHICRQSSHCLYLNKMRQFCSYRSTDIIFLCGWHSTAGHCIHICTAKIFAAQYKLSNLGDLRWLLQALISPVSQTNSMSDQSSLIWSLV